MNKIYKIVWNATRGCYVVASEMAKTHQGKKALKASLLAALAMAAAGGVVADAAVTVADTSKYGNTVVETAISGGTKYEIANQQVSGDKALNRFNDFKLERNDIANLNLDKVNQQINVVKNKIDIDGVVNALKDGKIGGDVYFFSSNGIAVGKTGVINVGHLTLGTNPAAGEAFFVNGIYDPAKGALGSGKISIAGTINAIDSIRISSGKDVDIASTALLRTGAVFNAPSYDTADAYRNSVVNMNGVQSATAAVATDEGIVLYAEGDVTMGGKLHSNGGEISVKAKNNLTIHQGEILSHGGHIAISAENSTADLQANPEAPENGGMLIIKAAKISSKATSGNSGDIEVTSSRTAMGVARVAVDDSTIDAGDTGDVTIHATAETKLYAWDIGDGAYAQVRMGKDGTGRNTITGKNVEIAARASTTGAVGEASRTDAEKDIPVVEDDDSIVGSIKDFFTDTVTNVRAIGSVTKVHAAADVDIEKTDINALGTGDKAGDIRILSDARSEIQPITEGLLGFGFNVGISNVDSHVNVDHSSLYAKKDVSIDVTGDNTVSLNMSELSLLDEKVKGLSLNLSWAELHSDVSAKVGESATISSEGNTGVTATSTRELTSMVDNGGNTLSVAGAVGIADTHATVEMNGTVYANGDVSVKAENTIGKEDDLYIPDTVAADVAIGDSSNQKVEDWGKDKASKAWAAIKKIFAGKMTSGGESAESEVTSAAAPWNKLGLTASTALLFSENDATASVNGKVRGISAGSGEVGAKSLSVAAETIARTSNVVTSGVGSETGDDGDSGKKENAVSSAVAYTQQKNKAEAFISGDVKTKENVSVTADMKIPYQNVWTDGSTSDKVLEGLTNLFNSTDLGLSNLVDSWTQTSGAAENASGAASITVVNYDNSAKAYIGKKDDKQTAAPKVEAGGDVEVKANTDITTVNFAGNVADFFGENAANLFVSPHVSELYNAEGWSMSEAAKAGLGGAALAVRQQNTTEAYIDGGAAVFSGNDVTVDAETKATNIAISTAGGVAKSVAIDATVGVNRIDNDTKARIGNATVTTGKNATVAAKDDSTDINLAGGFGISGSTGIGASVAYNHIMRDTEAAMNGTLKAGGNAEVSAENSGEIIAASIAGAVAYESKGSSVTNGAGSSGFHTPEAEEGSTRSSSGDSGAAPAADGSLEDLVDSLAGESTNISSSSDSAISKVTAKDSSMKGNTDSAKGGFAAAANVSVNRIGDTAKATVGNTKSDLASVIADALKVTAANDSAIKAISGALSLNLKAKQGASIAGAFMYNAITGKTEAAVENANLTLSGSREIKGGKGTDESLTVSAKNKEKILNIAASGSGASKGTAVAGQISLNWVDDTTNAHVKDSAVKADEAVTVMASDEGKIDSYTGAVSFSGGQGSAVGASIAVNLIEGDTNANMENSTVIGTGAASGSKTSVTAEEKSAITAIAVSGAAAGKMAGAFSGTGNWISTSTDAHVDNKKMNVGALTVDAVNHSSATLGVGNVAVGKNAAGASIAVMVNDSDVTAYAKSTDAKAGSLKILADNAYNGSAKDNGSDTTAKTVAVGASGGASKFAGSGSVTVNVISQNTDAYLGKGSYDISHGDVTIDAKSTAKLFGLAGGVALSSGAGIGAAVDVQKYTGHTYGYIGDAVTLANAGSVDVQATSSENLTSIAATLAGAGKFAGAGGAGAHDITTDTKAFVGKEEGSSNTKVVVAKNVAIAAEDTTTLTTAAGAGAASGTAGVGLTAAVEVVNKKVAAFVGDGVRVTAGEGGHTAAGSFAVKAKNTSASKTLANGLAAGGTAGVAGAASETFVNHRTDAYVGKNATVTATRGASIVADSDFTQLAEAGTVAGAGTAAVGLGNATVSFTGRTNAYTDTGAKVDGGTKVALDASQLTKLTYATVAGTVAGTAGVNGTVGVNVLDTETKAYMAGGEARANSENGDGISITASDDTVLQGGNGGLSVGGGGAGIGAAVGVTNIKKDTEAFVGGSATLETTGRTKLSAKNTEDLTNITVQGSGGLYAGLAGAVNVMNLTTITKAYTGNGVTFNATSQKGGDITVKADHTIDNMSSIVAGAAAGIGSLGAAVDVGHVKTQTNAYLGNNNKVYTDGALTVTAKDHMDGISTHAIAAAVGGFGISGSISVYNFGSAQSESDKVLLSGKTDNTSATEISIDAWTEQEINKSQTAGALAAYDSDAISGVKHTLSTTFKSDAPSLGEKGTLAMVGGGTEVHAKSVSVAADDKLDVTNLIANASGGAGAAAGASVNVVHTDTLTQAKTGAGAKITAAGDVNVSANSNHQMHSQIIGASASGGISVQGTEETWNDKSEVKALIGKATQITGRNLDITSGNIRGFTSQLAGASVAISGAVNGALVTAKTEGSSEVVIEEAADLAAEGALAAKAKADTAMDATALGAAVGTYAGTGTGVVLTSGTAAKTTVGKSARLTGESITVSAENTPSLHAKADAYGVGLAGVGITATYITSNDKALVDVGNSAAMKADEALTIQAIMDQPVDSSRYNAYADATAGAGGVLAGAVVLTDVSLTQETKVNIGMATLSGRTATIQASHRDIENTKIDSVGAGGVSGTGGETKMKINSTASVNVAGGTITTEEETAIDATNRTERNWRGHSGEKTVKSIGAALASGNGVVNETDITHNTSVNVGAATIKANASALTAAEIAAGKTLYDKNAIAIDAHSTIISKDSSSLATGAVVGAAHIKNTHTATATTTTTVGAATLLAGDTDAANAKDKTATYTGSGVITYDGSYKGGSIAVGSRNDATIESNTIVDVYGAAGYAGSENHVTYNGKANTNFNAAAETAKGDISVMAGRDADGNNGTISVTAHSDILNATAIPISIKKDPTATANSSAALDVQAKADIKSDRDIHLKANAGSITALGSGEVKDWVNTLADAFGAEGSTMGKKVISSSANVVMNGKADTGIHRQKSITIGGTNTNGTWTTTVTSDGDISYIDGGTSVVGAELSARLAALRKKLADFGDDATSKAAYEAEIQFLEEKMAAQGLGYFVKQGDTTVFIEIPPSGKSELELAKETLANAKASAASMIAAREKLTEQKTALEEIESKLAAYKTAAAAASQAKKDADANLAARTTPVQEAATRAGVTLDAYVADTAHVEETIVKEYNAAKNVFTDPDSDYSKTKKELETKTTAYSDAVTAYNNTYQADVTAMPSEYTDAYMTALTNQIAMAEADAEKTQDTSVQANLEAQIRATDAFFSAGGTETNGAFLTPDGNKIVAVYSNGTVATVGDDGTLPSGAYYLLHSEAYAQMTHNIQLGNITAQLGDILFEGDNVSGSGTLTAGGDASVTITNTSPNGLKVGDVKVVGRLGTEGAGQGGTIYYNNVELKGDRVAAISKANKDKTKSVSFTVTTRDSAGSAEPSITIRNDFQPSAYTSVEGTEEGNNATYIPQYAASDTTLAGYIYNPRGSVAVSSKDGDVYTDGIIYAGTVDMKIDNGDYIQTYDTKSQSIFSVGGAPLDDSGKKTGNLKSGILANGNVFISARYVNINSTIQSGVADYTITIPENYSFYYVDGTDEIPVTSADRVPSGHTVLVKDADGKAVDNLSYDFENDRFIVNDIEVHGGKVSIVGTIINTTPDTGKAAIKALDGYGQIVIDNRSGKDIELRNLSTGEGTEGRIEITDLDRTTGKIISKTTYTRDNGEIKKSVLSYTNGEPDETPTVTTYDKDAKVTYDPVKNAYYTLQTGQDKSYTATYELHETELDWWGISNKTPSSQDLLNRGASITNYQLGDVRTLYGGAIITGSSALNGATGTTRDGITISSQTYNSDTRVVEYTQKAKRLWYTLGLAKKYDYKLVEKKSDTVLTQYSVKADNSIGIGFIGNETGGTLNINGGSGNVIVNGTLFNGAGEAILSGADITQGTRGYIDAGTLTMHATGSAGTKDAAIRTGAETVNGSAVKDFAVEVVNHGVTAGSITSGGVVSLTADGDMSQTAGTTVTGSRVELTAAGSIGGNSAFIVNTAAKAGKDYGLKAQAEGNISITNTGGDLYLDSVTSNSGTVTLTTNGSFVDNNYTDFNNEDAQQKLMAWGNAAVLEGKGETLRKQKDQLIAKVKSKYNEFQALKAYVNEDGVYTLDENTKMVLATQDVDVDRYIAAKQARYDELKSSSVSTWTKADVEGYVQSIENDDSDIYGNASVTKTILSGDRFLTQEEKAEVLVGSAKSAKDLLVTFAPGSIKKGITDTKTTLKGTPHVSGSAITLTSTGTGSGHTDIGTKTTGMQIDLTDPTALTREQLLALSSAERGDFSISGNTVTVSSVRPIMTESTGALKAIAPSGAIYLISEGSIATGSELTAGGEVRLKATGSLDGLTVINGDGANLVLESGSGAIRNATIKGNGILTARAKDGVSLQKSDSDLIVNTVYSAEGDIVIDLQREDGEENSLLAESRDESQAKTYVNMEGVSVTVENVKDMKGQDDVTTLGIKLDDKSAKDINGALKATGVEEAHITIFGNSLSKDTYFQAKAIDLTVAEESLAGRGVYEATNQLVMNNRGAIAGGTFKGNETHFTNDGLVNNNISSPTFSAEGKLIVQNNGAAEGSEAINTINGAMLVGHDVIVKNERGALMDGTTFKAANHLSIDNQGDMDNSILDGSDIVVDNDKKLENGHYVTDGTLTINNAATGALVGGSFTGGTLALHNYGSLENGKYKATTGPLTIINNGAITGGTYAAKEKALSITDEGKITGAAFTAHDKLTYTGAADAALTGTAFTSETDHVEVTSLGSVNLAQAMAAKDVKIESSGSSETVIGEAKGVNITATSGGALTATSIHAGEKVDLYAKGDMTVTTLDAGSDGVAEAEGNAFITAATAGDDLTITSHTGSIEGTSLHAKNGQAILTAAKDVKIMESLQSGMDCIIHAKGGDLTAKLVDAGVKAELYAKGDMTVTTLDAGSDGVAEAEGNMLITAATAGDDLTITSHTGSIEGTSLHAKNGQAILTAAKDVKIIESLQSGMDSIVKAKGGDLTAKLVDAGEKAELYAKGKMKAETLNAGTDAVAMAEENISITGATAKDSLTITSNEGDIEGDTLMAESGNAKLTAGGIMHVTTLTAGQDAKAEGDGDITITTSAAGDKLTVLSHNGSVALAAAEATHGNADITAGQSVTIGALTAGANTTIKARGGTLMADSIKANDSANLYSQGFMDIESLETVNGNATLITDDSMDVTHSQIAGALAMKAEKDITVSQSDSVNKTFMHAGGSILTKGANANISADEIEMIASESIRIIDRSPVGKFTSVDLGEAAAVTSGSGDAGSLLNGEATGHSYDVTKKGTATLTARKGKATLAAKTIEADTAIIGTEGTANPASLTMEVDNAAIDDLQSTADTLYVMLHGNTSENTHYAGLHNSTDGSTIVKDSTIDHLNFTGGNDIGIENSTFAGDSIIQTEKVLFNLWKNPDNNTAESIGKLFIHDYDIASSEYFTRIRGGLTVNGERFPYTADSVMNKSLYGDNYLGKGGKEKEEENTIYAKELRFGEVTGKEAYRVVE